MLDDLEFVEQDKNIAKGKEQIEEWPVYSEVVSPQNDLWESFVVEEHVDGRGVGHLKVSSSQLVSVGGQMVALSKWLQKGF